TADRAVLEALRDPLVQLLRNAVDHGIESPDQRAAAGKPATGTVRRSSALQQDRHLVTVTDDGMGLDIIALRSSAESRGLDVPENDHAVAALLFQGRGISSKSTASELSGRGIGLDIVRTAAERLGGTVDVEWRPGEGTTFRLDLPVSLATWRVVLA